MSISINGLSLNKSQPLVPSSAKSEDEKENVKQSKKQFISQMEGDYFCTYLIDSNGNKILLNRIPVSQNEKQDQSSSNSLAFEKLKSTAYLKTGNANTDLEREQQATVEAANKTNLQGIMEILKSYAGLPNELECKHNLKG